MPFDPTKPVNNSQVNSAELRSQLASLKSLIDGCPTTAAMQNYVVMNSGGPIDSVSPLSGGADLNQVIFKINELIAALKREPPS